MEQLRSARVEAGLSQQLAARRLGVSQPYYSQLEAGARPLTGELAAKAVKTLGLPATAMPLPPITGQLDEIEADILASAIAALGYAPFSHLATPGLPMNPALIVIGALAHADLDVRLIESLPWVLSKFPDVNVDWLTAQSRLLNIQNRLAYVATLASPAKETVDHLRRLVAELERSRLADEHTLCRESMPDAERVWVRRHRSPSAEHWRLLTSLTREQLPYAA